MKSNSILELPLAAMCDPKDGQPLNCVRYLETDDIRGLLRSGSVAFAIADVGKPLIFIEPRDCYEFFKLEAKAHLANPDGFRLENFPGQYAYVASLWTNDESQVVLLEKHH